MLVTTISQASHEQNISVTSIRWQLVKNEIQPIDKMKWNLNGFIGQPYLKEDIQKVLSEFKPDKTIKIRNEKIKSISKYSKEEVLIVLRKHMKHYLWNKYFTDWKQKDWIEFNKLIMTPNPNNIEVIDHETVEADGITIHV